MNRVATPPAPASLRAWVMAIRPATLTVALAPIAVGAAVASTAGATRAGAILAAAIGAVFLQIGSNLANDVFDHEKGADTEDRLGPTRVTQAGLLTPAQVRRAMAGAFACATLAGAYLTTVAGWPIVAIGLASIAAAVAYTGGPYPLGYHGLGDLFVFLFFGVVAVSGTAFVAGAGVPPLAWIASIPVGAIATAVLVVNNVRDRETDVRAGKRTLAVRFGRRFGVFEYAGLIALAYATPMALAVSRARTPWVLLPLATLPFAWRLARVVATKTDGPTLNRCLAGTARLLLAFSVLFAIGIQAR